VSRRPASTQAPAFSAAPAAKATDRPRFGIGTLINRMAGMGQGAEPERHLRAQPPVQAYDDENEMSADQERIEIPAFLRRQAN
jgi:cell division protein FtsZ